MSNEDSGRRRFLARVVASLHAAMASTAGVIFGGAILAPGGARRETQWLPAGSVFDLAEDTPVPATVRVVREDGYRQIVDRRTVFLVRHEGAVTALDSTCTHLGCRVSWDAEARELRCPCHGGVFDEMGMVKAGPPPAPLTRLEAKIEGNQVLIQV